MRSLLTHHLGPPPVTTHLDDSHTTRQLGNALAELLSVIHAVCLTQLLLELCNAHVNLILAGSISNQRGAGAGNGDLGAGSSSSSSVHVGVVAYGLGCIGPLQ
jgi:hypothetical protein